MNDIYSLQHTLSLLDFELLHTLYRLRCLTVMQSYKNIYKESGMSFNEFLDTKFKLFRDESLIEEIEFGGDNIALFLSKRGVDLVRMHYDIPELKGKTGNQSSVRAYYRPSELKMLPRLIPHQVHLNQFVLDFNRIYVHNNLKAPWQYFDEKYVSQYSSIRPDGLIQIGSMDFFLELDMNTESKSQIIEKWKHYSQFLNGREYQASDRRITVLFILENTQNLEARKRLITQSAMEILRSSLNGQFDIFVDSREGLLRKLFSSLIPDLFGQNKIKKHLEQILMSQHSLSISPGKVLLKQLNYTEYGYYARVLNESKGIMVKRGVAQEYLLDYIYEDSLAFVQRLEQLEKNSAIFRYYFNRDLKYILICENLEKTKALIDELGAFVPDTAYFTTLSRLKTHPLHQAVFRYDFNGRPYTFCDESMTARIYLEQ